MAESLIPPEDESPKKTIADAASLFDESVGEAGKLKRLDSKSEAVEGSYEVEDLPELGSSLDPPRGAGTSPPTPAKDARPGMRIDPSAAVEHIWTRWGEWGSTITVMVIAGTAVLGLIYLLLSWEVYGFAFFSFLAGGIFLAYLSYPILITLERPIRITPEQAAKDFYAALSHHFPHYRRMWLLLSRRGKVSGSFASFEGFRGYWTKILTELRDGKTNGLTPLRFTVEDFKSPKSAGLDSIEATYVVKVLVRGKQDAGPIHAIKVKASFVKGPDRMWYLDQGTLP